MPTSARFLTGTLLLLLATATSGCAGPGAAEPTGAPPTPTPATTPGAPPSPTATPDGAGSSPTAAASAAPTGAPTPGSTANPAAAALASRPWATATLTEVASGQSFTIAGLAGRTIFVEAMAIWCTKCREQQNRFKEALGRIDPATVAYVVLTVDPGETAAELARYKRDRGFLGEYAVAGRDVSTALEKEFGATVLNPPTVPLILVSRTGEIQFKTGGESIDEIIRLAGA
jgi:hypothetical protein